MSKRKKIIALFTLFFIGISLTVFAQVTDILDLQRSLSNVSEDFSKALPLNASLGLNWSDSYIGKAFPFFLPHLGAGVSFGFTSMDLPEAKKLAGYLGFTIQNDSEKFLFPAYTIEARLGGIFFPFDFGFKFGYLPYTEFPGNDVDIKSLLVGGDLRFAIIDGKSNSSLPNLSLGLGVNYLKGSLEGNTSISRTINVGTANIKLENPTVDLLWNTFSLDLKAQISKTFLIFTPYLGAGGSFAWSNVGYSVDADVTVNGSPVDPAYADIANLLLHNFGYDSISISSRGISSDSKNTAFNLRVFGGFSINIFVLRIDLTGLYSFLDNNYGASLGLRFQL